MKAPQPIFLSPADLGLPYPTWRSGQLDTVLQILDTPKRFVAVQAPTGTGKSAIAGAVTVLNVGASAILTGTKPLQTQYVTTFGTALDDPLLVDVRGAGNYECLAARDTFRLDFIGRRMVGCDEGPCRVGKECELRQRGCLYFDAVRKAQRSPTLVTSYAYWISHHRFSDGLGSRTALLLDEAHDANRQLSDHLTIEIGKYDGVRVPYGNPSRSEWRTWASGEAPAIQRASETAPSVRDRLRYKRLADALVLISKLPDDWIWERDGAKVRFAPVLVQEYAEAALFRSIPKVVLLSATITKQSMAALGIAEDDYDWLALPSPFPAKRRPIYLYRDQSLPMRIDYRMSDDVESEWLYQIAQFVKARADRKGIVHSVSYERAERLASAIRQLAGKRTTVIAPGRTIRLDDLLQSWQHAPAGSVLISPTIGTGVDFAYQLAEYVVIPKVPFPDIRTPIAKARAEQDPNYRNEITLQTLIQMIGRGMRATDDQCETIIFDEHIRWFLNKHRSIIPKWIVEAMRVVDALPAPLPKLHPRKETRT